MPTDPQQPRDVLRRGVTVVQAQAEIGQALCHIAVETWRMEGLLSRLCDADRPRVQSAVERLRAYLQQAGVTIEDRTAQTYVDGFTVEILAIEERPDLPPETLRILETVKPSIYIAGQLAASGQVILGRGVATRTGGADGPRND
jgi:hypothetical protein